jgi:ribosomal protein L16/L10AE
VTVAQLHQLGIDRGDLALAPRDRLVQRLGAAGVGLAADLGAVEYWAARVAPGRIMFEIDGVPEATARESLRLGAAKLSVKTKIVARVEGL